MTTPALAVHELSARYTGAPRRAVDSVDLEVAPGEIVGILGPTGAGKSTLLKCLSGVIPRHDDEAAAKGRIEIFGVDLGQFPSLAAITEQVGLVMQDPELQLVNTTVREELAWGMENRGLPVPEIERRMARAVELFGIEALLDRFTHALSGGEKQRVVVASIFCLSPRIMLLDEPTSELDPAGTESVMNAVRVLADEGVTVIVVEHKVEELAVYADRLVVMDEGVVRQVGTPREVLVGGHAPYRPQVLEVALRLREEGYWPGELPLSVPDAVRVWSDERAKGLAS
ncbi:energy-coupling factor transporter ATPase [Amycolatopsis endophytica]|uniref:Energy-coupling factor transporter ATP-binding protein EcfA2 n=1 Tax=Amycolatopsis endophytica TaxID=860233 RepID=A0A853B281_9PSEU|nr:ABC transporter ATP-binding protein [Amycolatopsis endophytica]NYI89099.1 energy-coupling factor transporter ATP-binding protein EcfA2 [Amycolatopsis endophytica]